MENIIKKIKQDYPVSDQSIDLLVPCLKPHRFPKKYQLIKEGIYCKVAYFIEKGMTRSYWLVDGEEITTSFISPPYAPAFIYNAPPIVPGIPHANSSPDNPCR